MKKLIYILAFCTCAGISSTLAPNDLGMDFFTVAFENDVLFQEDGEYTNGLGVAWGYKNIDGLNDKSLPRWIAYLVPIAGQHNLEGTV